MEVSVKKPTTARSVHLEGQQNHQSSKCRDGAPATVWEPDLNPDFIHWNICKALKDIKDMTVIKAEED